MAGSMHIPSIDTAEVCRDWRRNRLPAACDIQWMPQDGLSEAPHLGHQVRLSAGRQQTDVCLPEEVWAVDRQISVSRHGRFLHGQPLGSRHVFLSHEPGTHTAEAASQG